MFEWFNRLYRDDQATNFTSKNYVNTKSLPQLHELINTYKPSVLWSDGEADASEYYWNSLEFLAWLYNESPVKDEVITFGQSLYILINVKFESFILFINF